MMLFLSIFWFIPTIICLYLICECLRNESIADLFEVESYWELILFSILALIPVLAFILAICGIGRVVIYIYDTRGWWLRALYDKLDAAIIRILPQHLKPKEPKAFDDDEWF